MLLERSYKQWHAVEAGRVIPCSSWGGPWEQESLIERAAKPSSLDWLYMQGEILEARDCYLCTQHLYLQQIWNQTSSKILKLSLNFLLFAKEVIFFLTILCEFHHTSFHLCHCLGNASSLQPGMKLFLWGTDIHSPINISLQFPLTSSYI